MKTIITFLTLVSLSFGIELGKYPKELIVDGENGAKVTGEAFSSTMLKDKVYVLFYVDPDEKELNEHVVQALKKEDFDKSKYGSVAVINMGATWLPNFAIAGMLKEKQEEFPNTTYVKDLNKVFVKEWNLEDDSSNVLLFDKDGKLIFIKKGAVSEEELKELISLIEENILV